MQKRIIFLFTILLIFSAFSLHAQIIQGEVIGGFNFSKVEGDSAQPMYLSRLNYAEIPLLIQYTDKGKYTFGIGASYSRLIGVKWVVNGRIISNNINDGYYYKDNFDWIADFKFRLYKQLKLNVRYAYSLKSISTGKKLFTTIGGVSQDANQRNSMISFRLIWVFNEEQSTVNLEKSKNAK